MVVLPPPALKQLCAGGEQVLLSRRPGLTEPVSQAEKQHTRHQARPAQQGAAGELP